MGLSKTFSGNRTYLANIILHKYFSFIRKDKKIFCFSFFKKLFLFINVLPKYSSNAQIKSITASYKILPSKNFS